MFSAFTSNVKEYIIRPGTEAVVLIPKVKFMTPS